MKIKSRLDFSKIYCNPHKEFRRYKASQRIVPIVKEDNKKPLPNPFQCNTQAPVVAIPSDELETSIFSMIDRIRGCKYSTTIEFLDAPELSIPEKTAKEDLLFKELTNFINEVGGIQSLIQKFKEKHLDDVIEGWMRNEITSYISPYQIIQIFGIDKIHAIMNAISFEDLELTLKAISKIFPIIVHNITLKDDKVLENDKLLFEQLIKFINDSGGISGVYKKFTDLQINWKISRWMNWELNSCCPSPIDLSSFHFSNWEIFQMFNVQAITDAIHSESLSQTSESISALFPVMINLLASKEEISENKLHTDPLSSTEVSNLAKEIQQLQWRKKKLSILEKNWNKDCQERSAFLFDILSSQRSRDSFINDRASYFSYRLKNDFMVGLIGTGVQEGKIGLEIKDLVVEKLAKEVAESLIEWAVHRAQEQEDNLEGVVYLNALSSKVPFYKYLGFEEDPAPGHPTLGAIPLILIPSCHPDIWKKGEDGKYRLLKYFGKNFMS